MLDGFWSSLIVGVSLALITAMGVVMWWLIRQRINVSDGSVLEIKNMIERVTAEVRASNDRMEANFKSDFSALEKRLSDECREMEHRFSDGMKEMNNKNQANAARISDVSEGLLKMRIEVLEEFMPTPRIEAVHAELRLLIKESVVKIEGQLEKMNDRLMASK